MRTVPFAIVLASISCAAVVEEPEGSTPASCEDGTDNDADSYVDCQDNGCWSQPACQDEDTDTEDTDETPDTDVEDTDVGPDTDDNGSGFDSWVADLTTVAFRYQLDIEPLGAGKQLLGAFAPEMAEPCSASYYGEGTLVAALDGTATYEGSWVQVEETCPAFPENDLFPQYEGVSLADASVWVSVDGTAFHTFRFPSSMSKMTNWVAHYDQSQSNPTTTPFENEQYWIKFTVPHTFNNDANTCDYAEGETIAFQGQLPMKFDSTFEVVFGTGDEIPVVEPFDLTP